MTTAAQNLPALHADFRASSTRSMPIAGMIYWAIVGIAALYLSPTVVASVVLFGSGAIFPLGILIDRLTGRVLQLSGSGNPLTKMFMRSLFMVVLMWPLVIIAARAAQDPTLIVLGGAILMGIIWIPFGWAADDPVGMEHAVIRSLASYAAYLFAPEPYQAVAIAGVVLLSYTYSLFRMRPDVR